MYFIFLKCGDVIKTISLCMIIKNEEAMLKETLKLVSNYVQEINILDTGSNDESIIIAKKFTDRIFYFEWINDFSKARNEVNRHARCDYILNLDADELIMNPEFFNDFQKSNDTYFSIIQENCIAHKDKKYVLSDYVKNRITVGLGSRVVLFPNHNGCKYQGKVHEVLVDSEGKRICNELRSKYVLRCLNIVTEDEINRKNEYYRNLSINQIKCNKYDHNTRTLILNMAHYFALKKLDVDFQRMLETHLEFFLSTYSMPHFHSKIVSIVDSLVENNRIEYASILNEIVQNQSVNLHSTKRCKRKLVIEVDNLKNLHINELKCRMNAIVEDGDFMILSTKYVNHNALESRMLMSLMEKRLIDYITVEFEMKTVSREDLEYLLKIPSKIELMIDESELNPKVLRLLRKNNKKVHLKFSIDKLNSKLIMDKITESLKIIEFCNVVVDFGTGEIRRSEILKLCKQLLEIKANGLIDVRFKGLQICRFKEELDIILHSEEIIEFGNKSLDLGYRKSKISKNKNCKAYCILSEICKNDTLQEIEKNKMDTYINTLELILFKKTIIANLKQE